MVSSYLRMRCPLEEAMARYGRVIGKSEIASPRLVPARDRIDLALANEQWLGLAVFVYASPPWTVFEELSGGLAENSEDRWIELAAGGDLVYEGYNDAISYAELLIVQQGQLARHIIRDEADPSAETDVGRLPEETKKPFGDWIDVTAWVEEDEDKLARAEEGWLWIHRTE
jgi:hypothetical protein